MKLKTHDCITQRWQNLVSHFNAKWRQCVLLTSAGNCRQRQTANASPRRSKKYDKEAWGWQCSDFESTQHHMCCDYDSHRFDCVKDARARTHTHTHAHMNSPHTHTHTYIYIYERNTHTHTHTWTHHTHTHTHTRTRTHAHTHGEGVAFQWL